jgi:subtilisin family serine protease
MTAIDPHLQALHDSAPASRRNDVMAPVLFEWDGDLDVLRAFGFRIITQVDDIIAAELPLALLPRVHELGLRAIELAQRSSPSLADSRIDIKADKIPAITGPKPGDGVIIGIIDTGIDYAHPSFHNAAGGSRILYIWDQRHSLEKPRKGIPRKYPEEALPRGFTNQFQWGVEYEKAGIDAAIAAEAVAIQKGKKPRKLRCIDSPLAHGTHVTAIASGTGAPPANPGGPLKEVGIAPHTELIVVAMDFSSASDPQFLAAIQYIQERAKQKGRPCVINMSFNEPFGARDGTSPYERSIDKLASKPGAAIVCSAGNAASLGMHASGSVAQGGTTAIELRVASKDPANNFGIEIWYDLNGKDDLIEVEVEGPGPNPKRTGFIKPGDPTKTAILDNKNVVTIMSDTTWPYNKFNRIYIEISRAVMNKLPLIKNGDWTIRLRGATIAGGADSGRFHAYLARERLGLDKPTDPALAIFMNADKASTVQLPATATKAIAVASYITTPAADLGKLSDFSSRGPTLDKRKEPVPTLTAPGQLITAARASNAKEGKGFFTDMQGTSMAAPHVTGVVAAMLQVKPTLDQDKILDILRKNVRKPAGSNPDPNHWGKGLLDGEAAVTAAKSAIV